MKSLPHSAQCSEDLQRIARIALANARSRLRLSAVDWHSHREDMMQTALLTVYEFASEEPDYLYGIVRNKLTDYALVNIYGRQAGKGQYAARGYFVHSVEDPELNIEQYLAAYFSKNRIRRPVEETVLAEEGEAARRRFWHGVEKEIMAILVATGGRLCKPEALLRYTRVVVGRLQGMTNAAIALKLQLPQEQVESILERARLRLRAFLEESPLMQGLIRAAGAARTFWHDEIDAALLNRAESFVAILPHGAFRVKYYGGLSYVAAARKSRGTVRSRQVNLGPVGSLTVHHLFEATEKLQAKLEALPA